MRVLLFCSTTLLFSVCAWSKGYVCFDEFQKFAKENKVQFDDYENDDSILVSTPGRLVVYKSRNENFDDLPTIHLTENTVPDDYDSSRNLTIVYNKSCSVKAVYVGQNYAFRKLDPGACKMVLLVDEAQICAKYGLASEATGRAVASVGEESTQN